MQPQTSQHRRLSGGLGSAQVPPHPGVSDSVGLGWGEFALLTSSQVMCSSCPATTPQNHWPSVGLWNLPC